MLIISSSAEILAVEMSGIDLDEYLRQDPFHFQVSVAYPLNRLPLARTAPLLKDCINFSQLQRRYTNAGPS